MKMVPNNNNTVNYFSFSTYYGTYLLGTYIVMGTT